MSTSKEQKRDSGSVQTVDRALSLLRMVAQQGGAVSLGSLCEWSGLHRTTVWRLMSALENNGFVERDSASKEYRLGYSASTLTSGIFQQYEPLVRLARPFLEELWRESLETVVMSVPRCGGMLTIDQLDSPQAVRVRNYLGEVDPLHCASNGKVILAYLQEEELEALLASPLQKRTDNTVTDPGELRRQIEQVRAAGYCMVFGEYDESENGISMPVLLSGRIVCVVNICGPGFRMPREHMLRLVPILTDVCARMGRALAATHAGAVTAAGT